ncbi:TPA: hypothetical protein RQK90_004309 [Vibrio vulnificus]|nr:hypothetical protein [Vibrio vulnificus]
MSQHTFDVSSYHVLCGWDRPLQGYFLVIEHDEHDAPLYSNLYEAPSHPDTFDVFLVVLARFGLPVPDGLIEALEQDKRNNVGNQLTQW